MGTKEKIDFITRFLERQKDQRFLNAIFAMVEAYNSEDTEAVSIEQYNRELDAAEKEYSEGKFISAEELQKKAKEW